MDLTHADVASETLAAVNSAAGIAYPETDAAATERRRLICAAAENGLLELVKARWPRPQEVTRRELSLAGGGRGDGDAAAGGGGAGDAPASRTDFRGLRRGGAVPQ